MGEILKQFMFFLLGAGGLAIINIIQERWRFRAERKAQKEDRQEEKHDQIAELNNMMKEYIDKQEKYNDETSKRFIDSDAEMAAQSEALKLILLDRILFLGQGYISKGRVTFDDRKRLGDMHNVYHNGLHGNGDADAIMDGVYALPLDK